MDMDDEDAAMDMEVDEMAKSLEATLLTGEMPLTGGIAEEEEIDTPKNLDVSHPSRCDDGWGCGEWRQS